MRYSCWLEARQACSMRWRRCCRSSRRLHSPRLPPSINIIFSQLRHSIIVAEVELPPTHRTLLHLSPVHLPLPQLLPEGTVEPALQSQTHCELGERSFSAPVLLDEASNALASRLQGGSQAVVVGEGGVCAVAEEGVDRLPVLVAHCQQQGHVAEAVPSVEVGPAHGQQLDQGEVVADGCQLQGVVAVLGVDWPVGREAAVDEGDDLVELVGGDCPEHAVGEGVGELHLVGRVPGGVFVVVGGVAEHEGVGGVTRPARQPLVPLEGEPLGGAPHGVGGGELPVVVLEVDHACGYL